MLFIVRSIKGLSLGQIHPLAPSTTPIFFTSNSFMYKHSWYRRRGSVLDGIGRGWYTSCV